MFLIRRSFKWTALHRRNVAVLGGGKEKARHKAGLKNSSFTKSKTR
jgi:hypothetical protein